MDRVTQSQLFNNFVNNMNRTLADLMETNIQASSQKRINRPSDDPVGTARVLDYRTSLSQIDRFRQNIDTAKGWLGLADETMLQTSNIITRARELAEQAATGTLTNDNREQVSYEVRQIFEQLINLSNTTYENKSIFAGQKTDRNAYTERLWARDNDDALDGVNWSLTGKAERSIIVQFLTTGDLGAGPVDYRYSTDGGRTFTTATTNTTTLSIDGVTFTADSGTMSVTANDAADTNDTSGTWLWLYPTAQYQGDDEDGVDVNELGTSLTGAASGTFESNLVVRIDENATLDTQIEYSYSLDGGSTWTTGNTVSNAAAASNAVLTVPGGSLTISSNGGNSLSAGSQFIIHPRTADINVDISQYERVQINSIGKDIFGGVYADPDTPNSMQKVFGENEGKNLFDTLGRLVAFTETNNQDGIQECLADLKSAQSQVMNQTASIAGRENRLQIADTVMQGLKVDESERLGKIEDADVGELMTKLARQQIAYEAVLKSSSMIMRLSLVNHI